MQNKGKEGNKILMKSELKLCAVR